MITDLISILFEDVGPEVDVPISGEGDDCLGAGVDVLELALDLHPA